MVEKEPRHEEEKPREIKDAESFEELYEILDNKGEIVSITDRGERKYAAEELKKRIDMFNDIVAGKTAIHYTDPSEYMKNFERDLQIITRAEGLRDKVSDITYKNFLSLRQEIDRQKTAKEKIPEEKEDT